MVPAPQTTINVTRQPPARAAALAEIYGDKHQPVSLVDLSLALAEDGGFDRIKEVA